MLCVLPVLFFLFALVINQFNPSFTMYNKLAVPQLPPPSRAVLLCAVLQGYMVLPEGDSATAIERWFFVPWLSKFAEEGGVSLTKTAVD